MLDKIKIYTFKLRENGQIPYSLYQEILKLNYESDKERIEILKNLVDKYTRIGGFYIRHPEDAYSCDKELEKLR